MEHRRFNFTCTIKGKKKCLAITVPIENGGVRTDKFCPQILLTGGMSFVSAINGEMAEDFISDCQMQILAMERADADEPLIDTHIAGLMAVVMNHINRCGRLIFGDLLIYMDCFSLLLEADGFEEAEIRKMYPRITRSIIELYPELIFNTADLTPFKGSHFDFLLAGIEREQE